jgi:hypothetical protein
VQRDKASNCRKSGQKVKDCPAERKAGGRAETGFLTTSSKRLRNALNLMSCHTNASHSQRMDEPPHPCPPNMPFSQGHHQLSACRQIAPVDPSGTLEKALERNLSKVKHHRPLPLLDLTLGEVLNDPSHSNKARIPRRWKCLRRVCPMQQ